MVCCVSDNYIDDNIFYEDVVVVVMVVFGVRRSLILAYEFVARTRNEATRKSFGNLFVMFFLCFLCLV